MQKRYWGYLIIAVYMLLSFDVFWFERVDPIVLGMPYALWGKVLYGLIGIGILYTAFKLLWPKLPKDFK